MIVLLALRALTMLALVALVVTQIWWPLWNGTPLFPALRLTPLKAKVDYARDEVSLLREQNMQLTELQDLMNRRAELSARIEELEKQTQKSK